MPKLNPEAQIKLNTSTLSHILKNYGLELRSFKIAQGGIENTTALISTNKGSFALRVYRKNKKKVAWIEQELDFMNFLRDNGLPIPQLSKNSKNSFITTFAAQGAIWKCILMEQMPGIHARTYSRSLIIDLAKHQAKMHTLGVQYAKKHRPMTTLDVLIEGYFIKKIQLKKLKQRSTVDFLHRAQKFLVKLDPRLPRGFNHLDYDKTNTLAKNDKLSGILDFDDLAYSPMVVCLGYTLWDIITDSPNLNRLRLYLKTYSKIRKLKRIEVTYLRDILLFRNYAIGSMDVLLQGQNSKNIKGLVSLEQILLKLDPKTLTNYTS